MAQTKATTSLHRLVRTAGVTPEVVSVLLEPVDQKPLPFDAGKFAMVTGIDKDGIKHKGKAYSVASEPASPMMELLVIKEHPEKEEGQGIHRTHFVGAASGDLFAVTGPNGNFTLTQEDGRRALLIASGDGLAPEIAMLRHMKRVRSTVDVALIYSVKRESEIIYEAELRSLADALNAKLLITVTRPEESPTWTGRTGRITAQMIKEVAPDAAERMCFVCGSLDFVRAMEGIRPAGSKNPVGGALQELGVPANRIRTDPWG